STNTRRQDDARIRASQGLYGLATKPIARPRSETVITLLPSERTLGSVSGRFFSIGPALRIVYRIYFGPSVVSMSFPDQRNEAGSNQDDEPHLIEAGPNRHQKPGDHQECGGESQQTPEHLRRFRAHPINSGR